MPTAIKSSSEFYNNADNLCPIKTRTEEKFPNLHEVLTWYNEAPAISQTSIIAPIRFKDGRKIPDMGELIRRLRKADQFKGMHLRFDDSPEASKPKVEFSPHMQILKWTHFDAEKFCNLVAWQNQKEELQNRFNQLESVFNLMTSENAIHARLGMEFPEWWFAFKEEIRPSFNIELISEKFQQIGSLIETLLVIKNASKETELERVIRTKNSKKIEELFKKLENTFKEIENFITHFEEKVSSSSKSYNEHLVQLLEMDIKKIESNPYFLGDITSGKTRIDEAKSLMEIFKREMDDPSSKAFFNKPYWNNLFTAISDTSSLSKEIEASKENANFIGKAINWAYSFFI